MHIQNIHEYILSLHPDIEECFPFGPETLVFKFSGKIFALLSLDEIPPRINLKCDPEKAIQLRERYAAIIPGFHMNKKHWNTLIIDGTVPQAEIKEMIRHSLQLIISGLSKAARSRAEEQLKQY